MDFVADIDCFSGLVFDNFEDRDSLFGAQFAGFCSEGLHTAQWVSLPQDVHLQFQALVDFLPGCPLGHQGGEVGREGVRVCIPCHWVLDILCVLLDFFLCGLLCVSHETFLGLQALDLADHDR